MDMRSKFPPRGQKRVRRAFLLFPKTINHERRWLEWAEWEEEIAYFVHGMSGQGGHSWDYVPTKWLD